MNQDIESNCVPHLKDRVDPSHPDADWGGVVPRTHKKRFYPEKINASHLASETEGYVPNPSRSISSNLSEGSKKQFPSNQAHAENAVHQPQYPVSDDQQWKTSYAAQVRMEATPKDAFKLGSVQNAPTRRHVTPAYEQARTGSQRSKHIMSSPTIPTDSNSGTNGAGVRCLTQPVLGRRSLLAGIGDKLVSSRSSASSTSSNSPAPSFRKSYGDSTDKSLLHENHHMKPPGYTGYRKY